MRTQGSEVTTFLFTRISGAIGRWEQYPQAMPAAVAQHDAILRVAIEEHAGRIFQAIGDEVFAAFAHASDAVTAALAAQRALTTADWGEPGPLKVGMALHSGDAIEREDGSYFAPATLNRLSRILAAAHGGQVLLSESSATLAGERLPEDIALRDLGRRHLRDLSEPENVYQLVAPDLPANFPPLNTLDRRPNNLPAPPTSFVGRENEVEAVGALFRERARLVTLTGPGGTGKTRLSLATAASLLDEFADGVFFVELAFVRDPQLVADTIARSLAVKENPGQSLLESLKAYLQARQLLLVLDNFEQIVAAAPLIADLLAAAPGLAALVSSREALHLAAEQEYAVTGLPVPAARRYMAAGELAQYPAIALFASRAQAVKLDFTLDEQNVQAVADICARLDGLPLAIELAAARVKLLRPQEILAGLSSRLALLTSALRDLPTRQRSLRGAIDWSYDLLDNAEKTLFARLGVFVGGCSVEAAEAVCGARGDLPISVAEGLARLADKSLVLPVSSSPLATEGEGHRFVMLETIREYALERLAERDSGSTYLELASPDGGGRVTMQQTVQEYALLKLAASGEAEALRRYHAAYYLQLAEQAEDQLKGRAQAVWSAHLGLEHDNLRAALTWGLTEGEPEVAMRIAGALFWFWSRQSYFTEGRAWLSALLAASDAPSAARAKALFAAGGLAWLQDHMVEAEAQLQASVALWREVGDQRGLAYALTLLHARYRGDPVEREMWLAESVAIFRHLDDKWGLALTLNYLGYVAQERGDYETAHGLLDESLSLFRALGDTWGQGLPLFSLAYLEFERGDYAAARPWAEQCLVVRRELGDRLLIASALNLMGEVLRTAGDHRESIAYYEESRDLYRDLGVKKGIVMTMSNKAAAAVAAHEYQMASAALAEELAVQRDQEYQRGLVGCLLAIAELAAETGHLERAATLLGTVAMLGQSKPASEAAQVSYKRIAAAVRAQLGEPGFTLARQQGLVMSRTQAIDYALSRA